MATLSRYERELRRVYTLLGQDALLPTNNQVQVIEAYLYGQVITLLQNAKSNHTQISLQTNTTASNITMDTTNIPHNNHSNWHITASPSGVNSAGTGCWLKGTVESACVVAIAPGLSLSPSDVSLLLTIAGDKFKDNGWLLARHDGWIVDGRIEADQHDTQSYQMWQMTLAKEKIAKRPRISNSYALGHLINHSKEPNTMPISFDFDLTKIPEDLHPFIPNALFSPSTNNKIPSIIFVTLRSIQDEELFFDYNFKPDAGKELPPWYNV